MSDYAAMVKSGDSISVCFYVEENRILAIGEKMNAICEDAYMNGDNWAAFLNYYLGKHAPELLEEMEEDPEAGMYAAYYPLTPENEERAERFVQLIRSLVENEEELYRTVREESGEIEWD
ncbi:MAG: immunity 51 family protein [Muribaculum sp.]|nr:immunity 51 family protein [Muribaculum sp.]